MTDLQAAKAEYAEILDRDSETSRNLTCHNWLIARQTRADALIAAYEAEQAEELAADNARLRAMLDDAARFVNPFRLGHERPSSAEMTAGVLAALERRQTARNEIPTTDTEENTMSRPGGG